MTWLKLDDGFATHPKIIALSDAAFRAYIAGLCHAGRYLTDGGIAKKTLPTLAKPRVKNELIEAGLWRQTSAGIVIHDFLVYNPPKAEVEEKRAKTTERVRDWRQRNTVSNDVGNSVTSRGEEKDVTLLVTPPPSRPVPKSVSSTKKRVPDELWEALETAMGRAPETEIERKRWNAALKELRDAGAIPEDVEARAGQYRREWPDVELTPHGLAANWSRFGASITVLRPFVCEVCAIGFSTADKRRDHLRNIHDIEEAA